MSTSNANRMPPYKLWASTDDGKIEFVSLTSDHIEGALLVLRESFFPEENICKGVDVMSEKGAADELEGLFLNGLRDGISVVAIDVTTGQVVGVAFNQIQTQPKPREKSPFAIFSENCKCKSSKAMIDFMIYVDSKVDLFKLYDTLCLLEVVFLCTSKTHRKQRIAELLVACSIEIGRQLLSKNGQSARVPVEINGDRTITNGDFVPSVTYAVMSSNYSQKIAEKLGYECLATVKYTDHRFADKTYQQRIGDTHLTSRLVAKRLN